MCAEFVPEVGCGVGWDLFLEEFPVDFGSDEGEFFAAGDAEEDGGG